MTRRGLKLQPTRVARALRMSSILALVSLAWLGAARAEPLAEDKPSAAAGANCVQIRAYAAYRGYGFDHIVELRSACTKRAVCSVKTDVNPTAVDEPVAAGETREVLTFRNSPASAFTPTVSCKLDG